MKLPVAREHGHLKDDPLRRAAEDLKIIAAILWRPMIEKILTHLGLDPQPPPKARAREAAYD